MKGGVPVDIGPGVGGIESMGPIWDSFFIPSISIGFGIL